MSTYRPITDCWILARAKLKGGRKYYGAYPGGFLERARVLIGCPLDQPMLHVCGGHARHYPYRRGFGRLDCTMDLNPKVRPDYQMDCRKDIWPIGPESWPKNYYLGPNPEVSNARLWAGILIDPPYSEWEAQHYPPGSDKYPKPNQLVQTAINHLRVGYKVGILHYLWPACPKNAISVAKIDVTVGFNNRSRIFAVYERLK